MTEYTQSVNSDVLQNVMFSLKTKTGLMVVALCIYTYFVLYMKTLYDKMNKLDDILEVVVETEKMIHKLQDRDRSLEMQLDQLQDLIK